MGAQRSIRRGLTKGLTKQVAFRVVLHKTGLVFGGEDVCLAVSGSDGAAKAVAFRDECLRNMHRSSFANIHDIFAVSGHVKGKLELGEAICN